MSGRPGFNYDAFNELADKLREHGYAVLNPAENFGGETDRPRPDYMRLDIAHVLEADAMMVIPAWETSRGSRLEVTVALEIGLRVYDTEWRDCTTEAQVLISGEMPTAIHATEERVTDPTTGGQKGRKLAEMGALDPSALLSVAEVAGYGSRKYARLNFMKGYAWSLSYDAMQRHLHAFWGGTDIDAESGLPHLAHAGWHALALLAFMQRGLGTDDRYKNPRDIALALWDAQHGAAASG
jgi:hypothetical protein